VSSRGDVGSLPRSSGSVPSHSARGLHRHRARRVAPERCSFARDRAARELAIRTGLDAELEYVLPPRVEPSIDGPARRRDPSELDDEGVAPAHRVDLVPVFIGVVARVDVLELELPDRHVSPRRAKAIVEYELELELRARPIAADGAGEVRDREASPGVRRHGDPPWSLQNGMRSGSRSSSGSVSGESVVAASPTS